MWDLPGPGLKPVYPVLAGGFLTPAPPGKPLQLDLIKIKKVDVILKFDEKNLEENKSCWHKYYKNSKYEANDLSTQKVQNA